MATQDELDQNLVHSWYGGPNAAAMRQGLPALAGKIDAAAVELLTKTFPHERVDTASVMGLVASLSEEESRFWARTLAARIRILIAQEHDRLAAEMARLRTHAEELDRDIENLNSEKASILKELAE